MSVPRRLAGFALAILAAFGIGTAIGSAVAPIEVGAKGGGHPAMTTSTDPPRGGHHG